MKYVINSKLVDIDWTPGQFIPVRNPDDIRIIHEPIVIRQRRCKYCGSITNVDTCKHCGAGV